MKRRSRSTEYQADARIPASKRARSSSGRAASSRVRLACPNFSWMKRADAATAVPFTRRAMDPLLRSGAEPSMAAGLDALMHSPKHDHGR